MKNTVARHAASGHPEQQATGTLAVNADLLPVVFAVPTGFNLLEQSAQFGAIPTPPSLPPAFFPGTDTGFLQLSSIPG